MFNKIEKTWLGLKSNVDYLASGAKKQPFTVLFLGSVFGFFIGTLSSVGVHLIKDSAMENSGEKFEDVVTTRDDGHLYRLPDDCDMDYTYYLIGRDKGGKLALSAGGSSSMVNVLSADEQKDQREDMQNCLGHLADWAKNDNFKFADDFHYLSNITYSSPVVINDIVDEKQYLRIDIIDGVPSGDAANWRMDKIVKDKDAYNEDGDNKSLYLREFSSAVVGFVDYLQAPQKQEIYYQGEQIKNADQYPVYDYNGLSFAKVMKIYGGATLLSMFMLAGPMGNRSGTGYREREDKRRARINEINQMSGRSKPLM